MRTVERLKRRFVNRVQRFLSESLHRREVALRLSVPLVSFTFDDFPSTALNVGGTILERYSARGTYYAALGLMNQDSPVGRIFSGAELGEVVARGHELGCHTYAHCHSWNTAPAVFEASILENQQALVRLLPGVEFQTMSYPLCGPRPQTKRRTGTHFRCCRGGGQVFNNGRADLNNLRAVFLEQCRDRFETVKELIDQSCRANGWLVFATHDLAAQPSRFGCSPEFFERVVRYVSESGARVLPVAEACHLVEATAALPAGTVSDVVAKPV